MPDAQSPDSQSAPCPLCGRASQAIFPGHEWPLREGGRIFRYRECPACELVFADPQPTADELAWLYGERYDYSWFIKRRGLKRIQARHRWNRLRPLLAEFDRDGRKRLLDVGGGHAYFLSAAIEAGWKATGLELLSDDLVHAASERGIEMHHGTLLGHDLTGREFDVITMWHVLEHMPAPREALTEAAKLLAPGGLLIVAVPNRHASGFHRDGLRWVWCQKPFIHPWHHSATSLRAIIPPGLELVEFLSRDTWDAQNFESTAAWRAAMLAIYFAARGPRKVALKVGAQRLAARFEDLQFLGEEALRLATYAAYLAARPFISETYEQKLHGSELMMICRKPNGSA